MIRAAVLGLSGGLLLAGAFPALAQGLTVSSLAPPATQGDIAAAIQAMQAAIPLPADTVPPPEMVGGLVGTAGTYRRADARAPRITRSRTLTLAADGTATFDWTAQGSLTTPVQVALTPVYSGSGVPKCWVTATTATSASVKCVLESVALLTIVGINVGSVTNSAPAGLSVGVIALPPS